MLSRWAPGIAAAVVLTALGGCAAASCPGVFVSAGVLVHAQEWAQGSAVKAAVCVNDTCGHATSVSAVAPADLFFSVTLPSKNARVRLQLSAADGRSLTVSTVVTPADLKPYGGSCAGTTEIDLAVDRAGKLRPGAPRTFA